MIITKRPPSYLARSTIIFHVYMLEHSSVINYNIKLVKLQRQIPFNKIYLTIQRTVIGIKYI